MGWVKMDDRYRTHKKVIHLSTDAIALDVCSMQFSSEFLTNGYINSTELRSICASVKRPKKAAEELVAMGRWVVVEDGWQIHDYLEYNPSKQDVLEKRAKEKERKAAQRHGDDGQFVPQGHQADAARTTAGTARGVPPSTSRPVPSPNKSLAPNGDFKPDPVFVLVAERRIQRAGKTDAGKGYMRATVIDVSGKYETTLRDLRVGNPSWTTEQLADALESPPKTKPKDPLEARASADWDRARRNDVPLCPKCDSTGFVFDDEDDAMPCPACHRIGATA